MARCDLALQSLNALEAFIREQEREASIRLDAMAKRRGVSFSGTEAQVNVKFVLERDRRYLRIAREALLQCDKKSLEGLIEEMRGLGHYFCSYCSDQNKLVTLGNELNHNVHQVLNSLD